MMHILRCSYCFKDIRNSAAFKFDGWNSSETILYILICDRKPPNMRSYNADAKKLKDAYYGRGATLYHLKIGVK